MDVFLKMNGKISNIDLRQTKTTYGDKNEGKQIISIVETTPNENSRLFNVQFFDGIVHRYAASWISFSVDLVLDNKYLK